ncbi:PadR family transcriptional regulator [Nocardioides terrisoli]|uniref:PadR family transcriptional regulator n=1 Tax=Nocardioides terrisoli TaxID=3388267 RepID=UPI00287B855C|nr:PadR family transcriptional regulator [Nocardioides marmorisolisilvae]
MALEHALLVSLREQPAAGLELARRFDRSIGFFWSATHQQIYKVLRRMQADGWVTSEVVGQDGRREKTVYTVTATGERALAAWIAETTPPEAFRSELAVKLRGASYGDRRALLTDVEKRLDDHRVRLAHYESMRDRDYPDPDQLAAQQLDHYLVLRGGLLMEQFWIQWLTEYLEAHQR